jgi:hypothetical protein
MFKNLSEEEILNYLMTSDFNEGLTPEEYRLLLLQFRNFYRIISGKNELLRTELSGRDRIMNDLKMDFERKLNQTLVEKADVENKLMFNNNRKLTLKERWYGKLIIKDETE